MVKGRVLILANTHFKSIFRVGAHHISDWLNAQSWQIDYFSSPISILKLLDFYSPDNRLRIKGILSSKYENVKFQVPLCLLPFHKTSYIPFLALRILLASPLNIQLNCNQYDIVIIDSPEYLPAIEKLKIRLRIYRPTDIYLEHSYEHYFLENKYVFNNNKYRIFCMSKESHEFYKSNSNNVIGYTANGVSDKFFAECSSYHHKPILNSESSLRLIYVGALDERLDYLWLEKIATIPGLHIEIYGDGSKLKSITKSRVLARSYRGVANHASLPQLLSSQNFALMPFSNDGKNKSRSPMKLYEYLSAGLPVLCNFDLDAPDVCFISTPTNTLNEDVLSNYRDSIYRKYNGKKKSDISNFALEHLWSIKVQSLLDEIKNDKFNNHI